jgi:hypothetical protein
MKEKIRHIIDLTIRIYLCVSLLAYSMAKIFNVQFGNIYKSYLNKKVSELSGQDLAWVFFGYSHTYEIIIGVIQLLAILLLINNKTKMLGMMLLFPILLNILFIDIFYDVIALYIVVYYIILLSILFFINRNHVFKIFQAIFQKQTQSLKPNLLNFFYIIIGVIILFSISLIL